MRPSGSLSPAGQAPDRNLTRTGSLARSLPLAAGQRPPRAFEVIVCCLQALTRRFPPLAGDHLPAVGPWCCPKQPPSGRLGRARADCPRHLRVRAFLAEGPRISDDPTVLTVPKETTKNPKLTKPTKQTAVDRRGPESTARPPAAARRPVTGTTAEDEGDSGVRKETAEHEDGDEHKHDWPSPSGSPERGERIWPGA
jgi:hypothetical protein